MNPPFKENSIILDFRSGSLEAEAESGVLVEAIYLFIYLLLFLF